MATRFLNLLLVASKTPFSLSPPPSIWSVPPLHSPLTAPPHTKGQERGDQWQHQQTTPRRTTHHQPPSAQPGASALWPLHQAGIMTTSTKPPQSSYPASRWCTLLMRLAPSTITPPPPSSPWCATSTALATTLGSTSAMAPAAWTSAWRVVGGWCGYWGDVSITRGEGVGRADRRCCWQWALYRLAAFCLMLTPAV